MSYTPFIDRQLADKGFGNVSEYFRSLLRDAQQRDTKPGSKPYYWKVSSLAVRISLSTEPFGQN